MQQPQQHNENATLAQLQYQLGLADQHRLVALSQQQQQQQQHQAGGHSPQSLVHILAQLQVLFIYTFRHISFSFLFKAHVFISCPTPRTLNPSCSIGFM
jgi:hypothetical protein